MQRSLFGLFVCLGISLPVAAALTQSAAQAPVSPGVLSSEFIYDTAPFPNAHASTIVESKGALVAAWASDGHVTYAWRRLRIKHVVIDPARLKPVPMPEDGAWPSGVR